MSKKLLMNNGGGNMQMQKGIIAVSEKTKTLTIPAKNCTNLIFCCANSTYTKNFILHSFILI